MPDKTPEDIYRDGILEAQFTLDLLPEDRERTSNLDNPEFQRDVLRNLDYKDAFRRRVLTPFRAFEEVYRDAPLGEHLAERNIGVVQLRPNDAPARLVLDHDFGFGIELPADTPAETAHRMAVLLNTTFFYGDDCRTRLPESDLEFLVFSDGQCMSRRDFEAYWCRVKGETILEHEQFLEDMQGLLSDFGTVDTVFVRGNGELYAP